MTARVSRRQFLKFGAAGLGASSMAMMGFAPQEALASVGVASVIGSGTSVFHTPAARDWLAVVAATLVVAIVLLVVARLIAGAIGRRVRLGAAQGEPT